MNVLFGLMAFKVNNKNGFSLIKLINLLFYFELYFSIPMF